MYMTNETTRVISLTFAVSHAPPSGKTDATNEHPKPHKFDRVICVTFRRSLSQHAPNVPLWQEEILSCSLLGPERLVQCTTAPRPSLRAPSANFCIAPDANANTSSCSSSQSAYPVGLLLGSGCGIGCLFRQACLTYRSCMPP